jgi:tRNA(Ile2) C34 agmatinyltransferase TiaS
MGRDRQEKERIVKPRFQEAESKVSQPREWRVIFRSASRFFTPLEKNGGFNREISLRCYVQYSTGRPIQLHIRKLDRIAEKADLDFFPVYLPDGIGILVLEKTPENSELINNLADGDRINVSGTTQTARYDSAGLILKGFIHVARGIIPGWGEGTGGTEENRMVDNLEIEITAPLRGR